MRDKQVPVFHEEGFQPLAPSVLRHDTERLNLFIFLELNSVQQG